MTDLIYSSAREIAAAIREKQVSSTEVMQAHLEHIHDINPAINAIVRLLPDTALEDARKADRAVSEGGKLGPFHGVPMTVKDAWEVEGVISTGGTLGRAKHVPKQDATVIARMRAAGAIPIGMTNLPELSMAFESDNLVHGRTNNPYDLSRTSGGSGGGGAAAIASGMSPIEIGADMGGSIRLPSHFCGIAGLRPTTRRAPMTGYFPPPFGIFGGLSESGPMARTVEDLALALPVICGPDWFDSYVQDVPLGDYRRVSIKGLRVAVHTDNGIMPARADVARTVHRAAKALSDAGAKVEEARPAGIEQCLSLFTALLGADGGEGVRTVLAMAGTKRHHTLIDKMLEFSLEPQSAAFLGGLLAQVDMYRAAMTSFLSSYDLILCPVNAATAPPHGTTFDEDVFPAFSYTIAYNLTGWPGAVVRCGCSSDGLPIGVQMVARPWREDVALAVAQHIESALGGYQRPAMSATA